MRCTRCCTLACMVTLLLADNLLLLYLGWEGVGPVSYTHLEDALNRLRGQASGKVIGIGSPRASLESNFALRSLVGENRFYAGIPATESRLLKLMLDVLRNGPAHTPSLHEVESADAVFILGEDVTNVAPRMALSLRQSVRQQPMQRCV